MDKRALYECFLKIRNLDEFAPFRAWLMQCRETHRDRLELLPGSENFHTTQGQARALGEILKAVEDAPVSLNKLAGG